MGTVPPPPSTPKAKMPERITADTPHYNKQTNIYCTADSELPVSRLAVASDLGQTIPQVDLTWFETNLLPPLPTGLDLQKVVGNLKRNRVIQNNRWGAYQADPRNMKLKEDQAFAPLKSLIGQIIKFARKKTEGSNQLLKYRSMPTVDMVTIYDHKPSKPDGYFVLVGKDPKEYYWYQIGVPGEYKLGKTHKELLDNRTKTTWNLYQQFREDPRRRFAIAYTIENTTMRLWFANRSEVLVSTPFDFVTDHATFVGFIMRIAFAKEREIGWDTTMKLRPISVETKATGLMYDITVHANTGPVVFRTKKLLNDVGARAIRGRGTRVWEVVKIVDEKESGKHVALKDSWVDADRKREAEILQNVKDADKANQTKLNNYLLTVDSYGDVRVDEKPDHTRTLHTNGQKAPLEHRQIALVDTALRTESQSPRPTKTSKRLQKQLSTKKAILGGSGNKVNFHEKQHHRAVFNEVGSSLYDETSLEIVFQTLGLVAGALQYVHQAGPGWVHRDISPGNILVFPDGTPPMKLADFEYAKSITDHNSHELRTGTLNFMSAEADIRKYRYRPVESSSAKKAKMNDLELDLEEFWNLKAKAKTRERKPTPPATETESKAVFFHNALHDLESVWWIAIWFLISKVVESFKGVAVGPYDTEEQRRVANKLFYNREARLNIMSDNTDFVDYIEHLHPSVKEPARVLAEIRVQLLSCYKAAEENPESIGKDVASGLHKFMSSRLLNLAIDLADEDIVVGKLTRAVASKSVDAVASDAAAEPDAEAGSSSAAGSRKRKARH